MRNKNFIFKKFVSHYLLAYLSTICIMCIIIQVLIKNREYTELPVVLCYVSGFLFHVIMTITWWSLVLAFLDKSWEFTLSKTRVIALLAGVWLVAVLLGLFPFFSKQVTLYT